jgi:hypothetical protein
MLRKLEQNIFPDCGRQVHAIVDYWNSFFTLQRQMSRPWRQFQFVCEPLQTTYALTIKSEAQTSAHQEAVVESLNFQVVIQRLAKPDYVVVRLDIEFGDSDLPL